MLQKDIRLTSFLYGLKNRTFYNSYLGIYNKINMFQEGYAYAHRKKLTDFMTQKMCCRQVENIDLK